MDWSNQVKAKGKTTANWKTHIQRIIKGNEMNVEHWNNHTMWTLKATNLQEKIPGNNEIMKTARKNVLNSVIIIETKINGIKH